MIASVVVPAAAAVPGRAQTPSGSVAHLSATLHSLGSGGPRQGIGPDPSPALTFNPTSGPIGTTLNLTGSGFTMGENVTPAFGGTSYTCTSGGTVNASGGFTCVMTVPTDPKASDYTVAASTSTDGTVTAPGSFYLTEPSTGLSRPSGPPNTLVEIVGGNGLAPNTTYDIDFDTTQGVGLYEVDSFATTAEGNYGGGFLVPFIPSGSYYADLFEQWSGEYILTLIMVASNATQFTVTTPLLNLTPATGVSGSTFTLNASGLANLNYDYKVTFNGSANYIPATGGTDCTYGGLYVQADAYGNFSCTYTVPSVGPGAYPIQLWNTATAYPYLITGVTNPPSGDYTVVGAFNATISPTSGPARTTVTLNVSGLAPSTEYEIYFDQIQGEADGGVVTTFTTDANGTYSGTFAVLNSDGFGTWYVDIFLVSSGDFVGSVTSPASGQFTATTPLAVLTPSSGSVGSSFTLAASGLAPNVAYTVTLNGQYLTSTGGADCTAFVGAAILSDGAGNFSCSFDVPSEAPGSYPVYIYEYVSGNLITPVTTPTSGNFTVTPTEYTVEFTESGLPAETLWTVTLNGTQNSSMGSNISFFEPTGTYGFSVGPIAGYTASPSSGLLTVNGTTTVSVTFTVIPPTLYSVIFTQSGLPEGTTWYVDLNGFTQNSTTAIEFTEPNGTYGFAVTPVSGYTATPSSGIVTVNGSAVNESILFTQVRPQTVVFQETGLPAGSEWVVLFNGGTHVSASTSLSLAATATGSYSYYISTPLSGWVASPASGVVVVTTGTVTVNVSFALSAPTYDVYFTASGIYSGTLWSVTFNGTIYSTTSTTLTIDNVAVGSYDYSIGTLAGFTAYPADGTVTVTDQSVSVGFTFTATTYLVDFVELGLPAGTYWAVVFGGVVFGTTTDQINFNVVPGTYNFTVGFIAGWSSSPMNGTVAVTNSGVAVDISFAADPPAVHGTVPLAPVLATATKP